MARQRPSGRTRLLGGLAGGAVLALFSAEVVRVWRLGTLPRCRDQSTAATPLGNPIAEALLVLREGYSVSRTREDAAFQPGQRDQHGDAGEDDGQPGGLHGGAARKIWRGPGPDLLAVARQDEQRVVHRDADPEQRRDVGDEDRNS